MPRFPLAAVAALIVGGALVLATAMPASAAVAPGPGIDAAPSQPYLGNPDPTDHLGSFTVGGDPAWRTEFGLLQPDSAESLGTNAAALTKWGTALDATTTALLPYLLWKYGDTTDDDEAAALAHVILSRTSAPTNPAELSPANDFRHIAYDAPFHLAKLTPGAQALVTSMNATPTGYFGPWTTNLLAPVGAVVGTSSNWTVQVLGTGGIGVPSVPMTVTVTGGTLPGGVTSAPFTTPADGSPLAVSVTPSTTTPTVTVDYETPLPSTTAVAPVDTDVSHLLRRSDNVVAGQITVVGTAAAPVAPTGPVLAMSGSRVSPVPAGAGGLAAIVVGSILLLASARSRKPRSRGAHRAL